MSRLRLSSGRLMVVQRTFLCLVIVAAVNWTLNVLQWRWVVRYDRLQASTWMGCLEVNWYAPALFPSADARRVELMRGGVSGRNGLATALAHVIWLPSIEQRDGSGQKKGFGTAGVPGQAAPHTRVTVPMWTTAVLSLLLYGTLAIRAHGRRLANLCEACDYSLVGLLPGKDGRVSCPECGRLAVKPPSTLA